MVDRTRFTDPDVKQVMGDALAQLDARWAQATNDKERRAIQFESRVVKFALQSLYHEIRWAALNNVPITVVNAVLINVFINSIKELLRATTDNPVSGMAVAANIVADVAGAIGSGHILPDYDHKANH